MASEYYRLQAGEMFRLAMMSPTVAEREVCLETALSWTALARHSDALAEAVANAAYEMQPMPRVGSI
jgi:hypothetical protein